MGAPHLEGSQLGGAPKSAFRPVCPPQNAPQSSQPQAGGIMPSRGYRRAQSSSCGPEMCLLPPASICKEICHLYLGRGQPREVFQVEGKGHPWGQSEGCGELPPGTLRGEACRSSSDCWVLARQSAFSLTQACLSLQQPKGTP